MTKSITASSLYTTLGLPSAPAIVDVRTSEQRVTDARYIPSAARIQEQDALESWAAALAPDKSIVAYCANGDSSRKIADTLAARGWQATFLEGGAQAWHAAELPTIRERLECPAGASRWVTRERPKIDRLACPWLVRRFVDSDAQFFYVPAHQVRTQAEALGAQPYDIADVTFSHRGPQCSFDAFLNEFDLHDPVLDQLAGIVRAADTGELSHAPQAHGLLAISLGLSANIPDDILLLEQAMPIYDALYSWCKVARKESHSWPQQNS